jgi:hypothetical protein
MSPWDVWLLTVGWKIPGSLSKLCKTGARYWHEAVLIIKERFDKGV